MGWKSVQEYYDIKHIVHVADGNICIGSGYILQLITINQDGVVLKRDVSNRSLNAYLEAMDADPAKLRELVQQQDHFETSIPVYTYHDGEIIEKFCEQPGWPYVTHDGEVMFNNQFTLDRNQAVAWAKRSAQSWKSCMERNIKDLEQKLQEEKDELLRANAAIAALNQAYPNISSEAGTK